jgi:hypothetical protein
MTSCFCPDINVWLALTFDSHIHHHLAAFAQTAQLELVAFDKGFSQYQSVQCTILSP